MKIKCYSRRIKNDFLKISNYFFSLCSSLLMKLVEYRTREITFSQKDFV